MDEVSSAFCKRSFLQKTFATQPGANYRWPGNIRELEQCDRNVMIRKTYRPAMQSPIDNGSSPHEQFAQVVAKGRFTLAELIENYVSLIYASEAQHYVRSLPTSQH